jgi:hypothetical protein
MRRTTRPVRSTEEHTVSGDNPIQMRQEALDPVERARRDARRAQFDRNSAWFEAHAAEIGEKHRGKHICVAGEELFVADSAQAAWDLAKAAHPDDEGVFFHYVYRERHPRIYAH